MSSAKLSGLALAELAAGAVLVWSGIKAQTIQNTVTSLLQGKAPTAGTSNQITQATLTSASTSGSGSAPSGGTNAQNKVLMQFMATSYGWGSGAEWTALDALEMSEAGYSDTVMNGTGSGAAGIAQNIQGWSSSYQSGNAPQQIKWMLDYIRSRYKDPIAAWAFHQANNWY